MFRYLIFYDIIKKQSGDWNTPTMIRRIWKEKRSPLRFEAGTVLFCHIRMYRTFADAKSLGCLPDCGVMFNNVASDVDRPLLNILFQKKTP